MALSKSVRVTIELPVWSSVKAHTDTSLLPETRGIAYKSVRVKMSFLSEVQTHAVRASCLKFEKIVYNPILTSWLEFKTNNGHISLECHYYPFWILVNNLGIFKSFGNFSKILNNLDFPYVFSSMAASAWHIWDDPNQQQINRLKIVD